MKSSFCEKRKNSLEATIWHKLPLAACRSWISIFSVAALRIWLNRRLESWQLCFDLLHCGHELLRTLELFRENASSFLCEIHYMSIVASYPRSDIEKDRRKWIYWSAKLHQKEEGESLTSPNIKMMKFTKLKQCLLKLEEVVSVWSWWTFCTNNLPTFL